MHWMVVSQVQQTSRAVERPVWQTGHRWRWRRSACGDCASPDNWQTCVIVCLQMFCNGYLYCLHVSWHVFFGRPHFLILPSRLQSTARQGEITGLLVQYWKLSLHSVLCTHIMSSSYRSNRFVFVSLRCICVFVFSCISLHACCIIVTRWGGLGGIEAWSDDWPFSFSALTLLVGSHDL